MPTPTCASGPAAAVASTMTSEHGCYVYVVLPGETTFVTAGRFVLTQGRHGPVGRFVYGRSYLARNDAVEIDPIELKLEPGRTVEATTRTGLFGALRDASPDAWGRRVIERHETGQLDEVGYLLASPDDRAGALGFGLGPEPPAPLRSFNRTVELDRLQAVADAVIADEPVDGSRGTQTQELLRAGTSVGGARPKVVVEDDGHLWIAKFNRTDDSYNNARVEHAMLELARECGIRVAATKVVGIGDRDALLVKRFDREAGEGGYRRARMLSALTLLRAEENEYAKWSYVTLAEELRRLSVQPKEDTEQLFRRMVFNALITNDDDHPRNHAVIAFEHAWRLSPAYDLIPKASIAEERRDLAMACGDAGRYANAENLISQHRRFLLKADAARAMVDELEAIVRDRWLGTLRSAGVSPQECERLARAFAYPGFRLPIGGVH